MLSHKQARETSCLLANIQCFVFSPVSLDLTSTRVLPRILGLSPHEHFAERLHSHSIPGQNHFARLYQGFIVQ
jgi:hypothetical protein